MRLCRFQNAEGHVRIGLTYDGTTLLDLAVAGVEKMETILESDNPQTAINRLTSQTQTRYAVRSVKLLCPVEQQEVWAAGVTYLRSKTARMEESKNSSNAYDLVYSASRPELFFKSLPEKVVGPGGEVGIRKDAFWNVPEPELALVTNSKGRIVGYTIGNDMSSRDIEGENLLYLPQAKVYDRSCAVGPWVVVGATENEVRAWTVQIRVQRANKVVFQGDTSISQIKRAFTELAGYLFRSQSFPHGAILLTGTGVVPPDDFSLQVADNVQITISGVGTLDNTVKLV